MTPERIKALRDRLGLSQDEAGRLFGSEAGEHGRSRGTWNAWESGRRNPSGPALTLLLLLERRPEMLDLLRDLRRG